MKKIRKSKYIPYALMLIAACLTCVFSAFFSLENKAAYAQEMDAYETVYIGDVFEAEDYTISTADKWVKAEGIRVVYPSGGVYGGDKFTVQQAGWYEATYYATIDGKRVEQTQTYLALRKPKDLILGEAGMDIGFGKYYVESPKHQVKKDVYGAIVAFKAGQSITFSTNIKTEKLTAEYNILDLIVMPSVFKETDFERLTVRVTDSKDANNFVDILIDSSNAVDGGGQVSYVRAGANGQQYGGYEGSSFHTANYGTQVEHSFRGLGYQPNVYVEKEDPRVNPANHIISENSLTVSIDNTSKKVYCGPLSFESTDNVLVNDLDDAAHYKGNPWGGFTSDEVTVSVTAGRFIKMEGKVLIKSFGDYDFSKDVVDDCAPEISVEYDANEKMPVAEVGKNFPIFPFSVKDALDAQVITSVWVYYKDAQGNQITVENDGKSFFAKYAGEYEIVYSAKDCSGNVSEERVQITAVNYTPNIFIAIDEAEMEKAVYQTVHIPTAAQMQAFGGSGALKVERAVYSPDYQALNVKDSLQLTQVGEYKVVYTVTDYLGNVQNGVITVRALELDKPTFVEDPTINNQWISGFKYELPEAFVVETVDKKVVQVPCKTYVKIDDGEYKLVSGSFKATGSEMSIRYVAEGKTGEVEWEKTVSVVDTEEGKYKSKYFYRNNAIEIKDEKSYVELAFAEDCGAGFINALYANEFSLKMSYQAENVGFSSMSLTLINAENRSKTVTVQLIYDATSDKWFLQLNNSEKKLAFATSKDILTFKLAGNGETIVDASGVNVATISVYDNGEPFEGFSDTLYFYLAFNDVQRPSSIRIPEVVNQTMGYTKSSIEKAKDEIRPIIIFDAPFQLRQKLGSKANIPTAKAFDVLGQISQFTVTVEFEGQVIASGSATQPLDFVFEKAGNYMVTYYAKDSNGNKESQPYVIYVKDETTPTLTVKNNLKEEYKVGDKITIPTYSATDNGENCYVQVTLIYPNNEMRLLQYSENGEITSLLDTENDVYGNDFKAGLDTFIAQKSGRYVLRFVAYDEYYNYTVTEIEFTVK